MAGPFREFARCLPVLSLLALGLMWSGCRSVEPIYLNAPAASGTGEPEPYADAHFYRIGELVKFVYHDTNGVFVKGEERINEAGILPLPGMRSVEAAGKTPRALFADLQKKYPSRFRHPEDARIYYVGGEVRTPGPKAYLGKTTVSTAIQAAGDFTEAANKRKVKVTRYNGRSEIIVIVDLRKAIHPPDDPPVYPGDKIEVPRK